jgi:uracil phosphoribosyltransferase
VVGEEEGLDHQEVVVVVVLRASEEVVEGL